MSEPFHLFSRPKDRLYHHSNDKKSHRICVCLVLCRFYILFLPISLFLSSLDAFWRRILLLLFCLRIHTSIHSKTNCYYYFIFYFLFYFIFVFIFIFIFYFIFYFIFIFYFCFYLFLFLFLFYFYFYFLFLL